MMTSRFRSRQHRYQAIHEYKADGFIEKPIAEDALLAALEKHATAAPANPVAVPAPVTIAPEPKAPAEHVAGLAETSAPAEPPTETDVVEAEIADRLDSILGDSSPDLGDPSRPGR
jgi:hypothetical protein